MNTNKFNDNKNDDNLKNFCRKLPKIVSLFVEIKTSCITKNLFNTYLQELHAHLNGSLSRETLKKLYNLKHPMEKEKCDVFDIEKCKTLSE